MDDFTDVRDLPVEKLMQLPPGNYIITHEQMLMLDPGVYVSVQARLASSPKTVTSSSGLTKTEVRSAETATDP